MIERRASFNTELTLCACADLSHTGHAHSAVDCLSASAVVLMVDGFVSHFEFENFFFLLQS